MAYMDFDFAMEEDKYWVDCKEVAEAVFSKLVIISLGFNLLITFCPSVSLINLTYNFWSIHQTFTCCILVHTGAIHRNSVECS